MNKYLIVTFLVFGLSACSLMYQAPPLDNSNNVDLTGLEVDSFSYITGKVGSDLYDRSNNRMDKWDYGKEEQQLYVSELKREIVEAGGIMTSSNPNSLSIEINFQSTFYHSNPLVYTLNLEMSLSKGGQEKAFAYEIASSNLIKFTEVWSINNKGRRAKVNQYLLDSMLHDIADFNDED